MLITLTVVIIHNVYVYQDIMLYSLNIYNFYCQSYLKKTGGEWWRRVTETDLAVIIKALSKESDFWQQDI